MATALTEAVFQSDLYLRLKAEYDHNATVRPRLLIKSFSEMVECYADLSLDFEAIGQACGISIYLVKWYYNRYFKPLFGWTGRERYGLCVRAHRELVIREIPNAHTVIGIISAAAEEAGLTVHRVFQGKRERDEVCSKALHIQGYFCSVHDVRNFQEPTREGGQSYAHVYFPKAARGARAYDAHILCIRANQYPTRILVVPEYVIAGIRKRKQRPLVWIPLAHRQVYMKRRLSVDWSKYEAPKAWKFLA